MSESDNQLAVAAKEATRVQRRGQWRQLAVMMGGATGGIVVAILVSGTSHLGMGLTTAAPTFAIMLLTFLLQRRGLMASSPLWSLSRAEQRLIRDSVDRGQPVSDPRLVSAVIEGGMLAEQAYPRALAISGAVFVFSVACWIASLRRYDAINPFLGLAALAVAMAVQQIRSRRRLRRTKAVYLGPTTLTR